ncbi:hypothetical protein FGO68_gene486 [Halteria grandinella]|uniref:Cyclic nucleotide-binding domain-containing protein n=1 Tax=Halteria grandinella TaxID=5974 RepID=A0A8J8NPT6_HALGN|nr:hypothetical protein FGO68_gene486 [Halteria grandinella]
MDSTVKTLKERTRKKKVVGVDQEALDKRKRDLQTRENALYLNHELVVSNGENSPDKEYLECMKQWLEKQYGDRAFQGDKQYREYLQREDKVLETLLRDRRIKRGAEEQAYCTDSSDEDEQTEHAKRVRARRMAVASEVGAMRVEQMKHHGQSISGRSMKIKEGIIAKLVGSLFMFQNLSDEELLRLVDSMEEKVLKPGEILLKKGELQSHLYLAPDGALLIDDVPIGGLISQEALLYPCKSAVSIIANNEGAHILCLERSVFKRITLEYSKQLNDQYDRFISQVFKISNPLLAQALLQEEVAEKHVIIREGETSKQVYLMVEGTAVGLKRNEISEDGELFREVQRFYPGDYFNEGGISQMSVVVTSKTGVIASINRDVLANFK